MRKPRLASGNIVGNDCICIESSEYAKNKKEWRLKYIGDKNLHTHLLFSLFIPTLKRKDTPKEKHRILQNSKWSKEDRFARVCRQVRAFVGT